MRSTKRKVSSLVGLILIIAAIFITAYTFVFGIKNIGDYEIKPVTSVINKGLDLQGGVSVLEEIQSKTPVNKATINQTIKLITRRINPNGVSEISVSQEGSNRVRVEVPGVYDTQKVINTIDVQGDLKFTGPDNKVILTGKDVDNASVGMDNNARPVVNLKLKSSGTKKFAAATQKFIGQAITISMDNKTLTSPTVDEAILGGTASISGMQSNDQAKEYADIINSGASPVKLKNVEHNVIGATLGANAFPQSLLAAEVGIGLVMLFMILRYRVQGIFADVALVLYVILVLGTFSSINATLTLSGIAGFLLTVGMAVDANVLIFERTKEELRAGKSIKTAMDQGYHRALPSIFDSNITTIIAGIILYNLGNGTVKGFALTLVIGVVVSMFTAIVVSRTLLKLAQSAGILNKLWQFGVKKVNKGEI